MLSLPPGEILALIKQEHAERHREAANEALLNSGSGWHWPNAVVRLWHAIRTRPEVHPSDALWPTLNDYPCPQPR
jgi:hypothetical protein